MVDTAAKLSAPDQVGQVASDRAKGMAGRAGQLGLAGHRGRAGEERPVRGARMLRTMMPSAGTGLGGAWVPVSRRGEHKI